MHTIISFSSTPSALVIFFLRGLFASQQQELQDHLISNYFSFYQQERMTDLSSIMLHTRHYCLEYTVVTELKLNL